MKVKIEYTIEVPDDYRRAINIHYGEEGLASRETVKDFYRHQGESNGDIFLGDLMISDEMDDEA